MKQDTSSSGYFASSEMHCRTKKMENFERPKFGRWEEKIGVKGEMLRHQTLVTKCFLSNDRVHKSGAAYCIRDQDYCQVANL